MANYQLNKTGEEIEQALSLAVEHETTKANVSGFYAGMSVGYAEGIISDRQIDNPEAACPPVTFGATGGNAEIQNGRFKFEKLLGNTIVSGNTLKHSKSAKIISRMQNQWDEDWELGTLDNETGEKTDSANNIRSKNYVPVVAGTTYFANSADNYMTVHYYDAQNGFIGYEVVKDNTFTTPNNCRFIRFRMEQAYGTTYNNDICIYINYDTPNLPYVAYEKNEITLPNIELKSAGIGAKIVRDELYQIGGGLRKVGEYVFDGQETWSFIASSNYWLMSKTGMPWAYISRHNYTSNGYLFGTYSAGLRMYLSDNPTLSSESDMNSIFSAGVSFTYELRTPTEITTSENAGWDELVKVDNYGTIQFLDNNGDEVEVPQGYFVRYTVNLVEFLDTMYVHTGGNGNAIPLIPDPPTTDGSYKLKVTITDGNAVYSWEAEA